MLSDIFSPVCLSVTSYIIFLRNRKTKNYFFHISYNVFLSYFIGFFIPCQGIFYTTQILIFHWQRVWFLHWWQLF